MDARVKPGHDDGDRGAAHDQAQYVAKEIF